MVELNIPGWGWVHLEHLVLDVNGTLAVDGQILDGLPRMITRMRDRLEIHLLTADTHGRQAEIDRLLGIQAKRVQPGDEAGQKASFVDGLKASSVVAIGQGANDAAMLKKAAFGICVLSREGTAVDAMLAADLLVANIYDAFELLEKPLRIVASLRK